MQSTSTASQYHRVHPLAIAIAAAVTLHPLSSAALGLGQVSARSSLGEPLKSQIELHRGSQDQGGRVEFEVSASPNALPGVPLPRLVTTVGADGSVLMLETNQPVTEPVVMFRLTARSAAATVTRDYTLLLDPPRAQQATARRPQAPAKLPVVSSPGRAPAKDRVIVAAGETLWEIGTRLAAGTPFAGSQLAWALFEANPGAFGDGRPESLLAGAVLNIPGTASVRTASATSTRAWLRGGSAPGGAFENLARAGGPSPFISAAPVPRGESRVKGLATNLTGVETTSAPSPARPRLDVRPAPGGQDELPSLLVAMAGDSGDGQATASAAPPHGNEVVSLRLERTLGDGASVAESQAVRLARLEASVQQLRLQLATREAQVAQLLQDADSRSVNVSDAQSAMEEPGEGAVADSENAMDVADGETAQLAGLFGAGSGTLLVAAASPYLISRLVVDWSRRVLSFLWQSAKAK